MCGQKKDISMEQSKASQAVKGKPGIVNITACLDRKLESDATDCIKVLIDGELVEKMGENKDAVEKES
jgi:hypothetical protein